MREGQRRMERDRGGVVEVVAARCARGSRENGDNEQERRGSGKGFRRERERETDRQTERESMPLPKVCTKFVFGEKE